MHRNKSLHLITLNRSTSVCLCCDTIVSLGRFGDGGGANLPRFYDKGGGTGGTAKAKQPIASGIPSGSWYEQCLEEICRKATTQNYHSLTVNNLPEAEGSGDSRADNDIMPEKPPLHETSAVVASVMARAPSERLKEYNDAGCRHFHTDQVVVVKLDNALKGLHSHVQQAQIHLQEIQGLTEQAGVVLYEDLNAQLENACLSPLRETNVEQRPGSPSEQVTLPRTKVRQIFSPDYVTTMIAIQGMLEQDFQMQEKIVKTLRLDTPSEVLQNYCMMWTLRPFVNETVVDEALSWIRPYRG